MKSSLVGSDLLCSFDSAGLSDWYAKLATGVADYGPWALFEAAQKAASETDGGLRAILEIFVLNRAVHRVDLIHVVGETTVNWLSFQRCPAESWSSSTTVKVLFTLLLWLLPLHRLAISDAVRPARCH